MNKQSISSLKKNLHTTILAKELLWFDEIDSTQKYLKNLPPPVKSMLAVSAVQTSGYGRNRSDWSSPEGGLWFSFCFCQDIDPEKVSELVPVTAVSVIEVLQGILGPTKKAYIKEPNDILYDGKKLCGCIVETSVRGGKIEKIVAGIGMNVNNDIPEALADTAISLSDILGRDENRGALLASLINTLDKNYVSYFEGNYPAIYEKYRSYLLARR